MCFCLVMLVTAVDLQYRCTCTLFQPFGYGVPCLLCFSKCYTLLLCVGLSQGHCFTVCIFNPVWCGSPRPLLLLCCHDQCLYYSSVQPLYLLVIFVNIIPFSNLPVPHDSSSCYSLSTLGFCCLRHSFSRSLLFHLV